jgi:methyltransferase family protein
MTIDFADRLARLDESLFSAVPTQSTAGDRRAWLAVQRAIRCGGYSYLETGSFLGGSIQQHLLDPLCRHIISIDKRPPSQPDERDEVIEYGGATTARMMEYLNKVANPSKVIAFETDARDVDVGRIPEPPSFCFIDGEHTHAAVLSDFEFCLRVAAPNAAICFHDARIVHSALATIMQDLRARGVQFTPLRLTGDTFGIFLGDCPAIKDPYIAETSSMPGPFFAKMRIRKVLKSCAPGWALPALRKLIPAP